MFVDLFPSKLSRVQVQDQLVSVSMYSSVEKGGRLRYVIEVIW